jgi:probable F420-dependent oxidoreductase
VDVYTVLPTFGSYATPSTILDGARLAEELGFHGVATTDHVLVPNSSDGSADRYACVYDVLTVLASVASVTERVRLMTSIVVLPMREPILVAKQVATTDRLSNGRVVLGLGAGYNKQEFDNIGSQFARRGQRLDEGVRYLRHLFSGSLELFEGEFYGNADGLFDPVPERGAGLPLMLGGNSDVAIARAARLGDLWQSNPNVSPDEFPERRRLLESLAGERRVSPGARVHMTASVEEMRSKALAYLNAGAEHLTIEFFPFEAFDDKLRLFAREVLATVQNGG